MNRIPDPAQAPPSAPAGAGPLADLAERILAIAREITLATGEDAGLLRLTATEIQVLRQIGRHPGSPAKAIARRVHLQRSNFSVALRSLRDRGLVAVRPDPLDGRSVRLFATGRAQEDLARHRSRWAACLAGRFEDPQELQVCLEALGRLDEALESGGEPGAAAGS